MYYRWSPYLKRYVWTPYRYPYYSGYYDYLSPSYTGNYKYNLPYYYYYNSPYYYSKNKRYPYYWYYYRPYNYWRYLSEKYCNLDEKTRMDMYKKFLETLPKNRAEMVNEFEITDDLLKSRSYEYLYDEPLRSLSPRSYSGDELNVRPRSALSTDSEISLSRAMTDSEIDYELCKRMRQRTLSDPFCDLKTSLRAFPDEYLVTANSFQTSTPPKQSETQPENPPERPYYNEALLDRMRRFLDEECRPFSADDQSLLELEDAVRKLDLQTETACNVTLPQMSVVLTAPDGREIWEFWDALREKGMLFEIQSHFTQSSLKEEVIGNARRYYAPHTYSPNF